MKIAVDIRRLTDNHPGDYGYFLCEVLKRVTKKNPTHEFLFFFDRSHKINFLFEKNVTAIATSSPTHPLLLKLWYDIKLPGLLKKCKADVFVSGDCICSLTTNVPQCIIINDLSYLFFPSFSRKVDLYFLKNFMKKFLQKASSIIAVSELVEKSIISSYAIEKEKISVVKGSGENFYPLNETEKDEVKEKYTTGKNFFIYAGAIDQRKNLVNLLKAFSVFKRRQKSDWKLVLAGAISRVYRGFENSLKTYKYRDDVVLTGRINNDEIARLTGAAYAFVFPSLWEGSGGQVLAAMKSHIPVITTVNSAMEEIAGEAALYTSPSDYKEIAEKMMLLYKDESLRNSLIEKGKIISDQYTWDKAADTFWQAILKAKDARDKGQGARDRAQETRDKAQGTR